ncbi:MAG: thioesterase [Caulobacteraceae bacterium]|nr:thioesterase [Caulobacteraceae bacterium]
MIHKDMLQSGRFVSGTPHSAALGMEMVEVGPGHGVIRAAWREDLVGDAATGVLAGGVVTAMLDHVCGLAVMAALTDHAQPATIDLRIDYLRPAEPGRDLFARADCYRLTRTVAFVRASAYEADPGHPVAIAQGTFVLNREEPGQ